MGSFVYNRFYKLSYCLIQAFVCSSFCSLVYSYSVNLANSFIRLLNGFYGLFFYSLYRLVSILLYLPRAFILIFARAFLLKFQFLLAKSLFFTKIN